MYARSKQMLFYVAALTVPVLALFLRLALERRYGDLPHYVLFFPVVLVIAILGGAGPGILATASSAILAVYWVLPPKGQLRIDRTADAIGFAIFCVMGVGGSGIAGLFQRTRHKLATYEKEQAVRNALRESERRFRALVSASSDVIYLMSPDWSELRLLRSQRFLAETNAPTRDWLQRYIPPDDRPLVLGAIAEAIRTKGIFELEHRVFLADGSLGWTLSRATPLMNADNEILEWFGAATDISERKRAEEALKRSEQRLRLAQQIARVGAFDWDIRTGVQTWTPELEALYGLPPGSFAGTQTAWENLLHDEDRPEALKCVERSFQTGAVTEGEWRVTWPDGSVHWLAGRWQVSKDELGNPSHMTGFNIDITQRKLAEQALISSEKLASVGRMAATIAHEVNNPLAGAVNAIYLASTDPAASPQVREALALADQELRRAAHITQQTLGFYRESGKRTPVSLPKLINEVLAVYSRKVQERGISVSTRFNCGPCREGCDTCFIVSSGEMRQVISNLLGNGLDALRNGGRLYIRLARVTNRAGTGQDIHLTIADNGCGIRTENLKRIFEPFFTTKASVGTGLGLWITQELVRNHNGSIKVRSSRDKGTVFRVSIPAMPTGASQTATSSRS